MKTFITILSIGIALACINLAQAKMCTTKSGYPAAISKADWSAAIDYAVAKDYVALQKLMESGRAIMLRAGVRVHLVDTILFSGAVKIRPPGETITFWTNIEAVDCD